MASKRMIARALVVAAAAPMLVAISPAAQAAPACLAWLGSKADGKCISWSMSSGAGMSLNGVPITVNGPNTGGR